jgi:uroporphyrinogen-III synthase
MAKPLAGRTVVVTRPRAQSALLAAALRARGARVVFAPLIRVAPPRSTRGIDAALRGLARFDAAVFASANAVERFFGRADSILPRRPPPPRVLAAVGGATRAALARRGWRAALVPERATAADLARALKLPRGARVLVPGAQRRRPELPALLRRGGARVVLATAYRTVFDPAGQRALSRALAAGADAACFASGSAVASAEAALGRGRARRAFRDCAAVAIGPTTAAELRARGIAPAVAAAPDAGAFADAVSRALRGRG